MTIERIYAMNGHCANFWVQHRKWGNICGQVVSVAGQRSGALVDATVLNSESQIELRTFDVRSGRRMELDPDVRLPLDSHYKLIAEPCWFREPVPSAATSRKAPSYTRR